MEKDIIQFSCQIDAVSAKNDRTLSIKLGTQELSANETSRIFYLMEKQIWVAFAETPLTKEDLNIPEVQVEKGRKTPSQRLRDRMFVYFKESKKEGRFDDWYERSLEQIGDKYLEKLV